MLRRKERDRESIHVIEWMHACFAFTPCRKLIAASMHHYGLCARQLSGPLLYLGQNDTPFFFWMDEKNDTLPSIIYDFWAGMAVYYRLTYRDGPNESNQLCPLVILNVNFYVYFLFNKCRRWVSRVQYAGKLTMLPKKKTQKKLNDVTWFLVGRKKNG